MILFITCMFSSVKSCDFKKGTSYISHYCIKVISNFSSKEHLILTCQLSTAFCLQTNKQTNKEKQKRPHEREITLTLHYININMKVLLEQLLISKVGKHDPPRQIKGLHLVQRGNYPQLLREKSIEERNH